MQGKETSVTLQHLDKRILKNLPALIEIAWPHLKRLLREKEDTLLYKHVCIVSAIMKELGKFRLIFI